MAAFLGTECLGRFQSRASNLPKFWAGFGHEMGTEAFRSPPQAQIHGHVGHKKPRRIAGLDDFPMVAMGGLEPPTPAL